MPAMLKWTSAVKLFCVLVFAAAPCAGNHCWGGERGRDAGHGRIVVSVSNGKSGADCGWDVVKVSGMLG
jgi:hypothetical protein